MNTYDEAPLSREEEEAFATEDEFFLEPSAEDLQDYLTGNLLTERP